MCEGQNSIWTLKKRSDVTLKEYIEMIRLKTSVLLGCSLQFGAIVTQRDLSDFKKNILNGKPIQISAKHRHLLFST
ncbi:MAG: hypothetical protein IPH66_15865 [Crocinitomicaceae bacterium]|nr:hypothetical protein [Crocinitomicaceae bacterium]